MSAWNETPVQNCIPTTRGPNLSFLCIVNSVAQARSLIVQYASQLMYFNLSSLLPCCLSLKAHTSLSRSKAITIPTSVKSTSLLKFINNQPSIMSPATATRSHATATVEESPPPRQDPGGNPPNPTVRDSDGDDDAGRLGDTAEGEENKEDEQLVQVEEDPVQPTEDLYAIPEALKLQVRKVPYTPTNLGIGVSLSDDQKPHVVLCSAKGDCVRFNEIGNRYARKLIALTVADMRRLKDDFASKKSDKSDQPPEEVDSSDEEVEDDDGEEGVTTRSKAATKKGLINRVGEKESFYRIIKIETKALVEELGWGEEQLTVRQLKTMWYIMCGFNRATQFNGVLDDALLQFAKYRIGAKKDDRIDGDEVKAAAASFKPIYKKCIKKKPVGKGAWTTPLVFLLNEHMKLRNITPLSISDDYDIDTDLKVTQRANHSTTIWRGGTRFQVENRESVIDELRNFAKSVFNVDLGTIPKCRGAPEGDASERPKKRHRGSIWGP